MLRLLRGAHLGQHRRDDGSLHVNDSERDHVGRQYGDWNLHWDWKQQFHGRNGRWLDCERRVGRLGQLFSRSFFRRLQRKPANLWPQRGLGGRRLHLA
jgi:hypothetical protein